MNERQTVIHRPVLPNVSNSYDEAIIAQQGVTAASYPLLVSFLSWTRKIKSTKNNADIAQENAQYNKLFADICKNNYFFYLIVTRQFEELWRLYDSLDKGSKIARVIRMLQKEYDEKTALAVQYQYFEANKQALKLNTPKPVVIPSSPIRPIDMYAYFDGEIKRATEQYQLRQLALVNTHSDGILGHFHDALKILRADPEKNKEAIAEIETLMTEFENIKVSLPDNNDLDGQKKADRINETVEKLKELVRKYPQLTSVLKAIEKDNEQFKKEFSKNKQEFQQLIADLTDKRHEARVSTITDLNKNLMNIQHMIESVPTKDLDPKNVAKLNELVSKMASFREQSMSVGSPEAMQALMKQCKGPIQEIGDIIKPVLPKEIAEKWEREVDQFKTLSQNVEELMKENKPLPIRARFIAPSAPPSEETNTVSTDLTFEKLNIKPTAPPFEEMDTTSDAIPTAPTFEETMDVKENPTHVYKGLVQNIVNRDPELIINEDQRDALATLTTQIKTSLDELKAKKELTMQQATIEKIETVLSCLEQNNFKSIKPTLLSSINENLEKLSSHDNNLLAMYESLKTILPAEEQPLVNNCKFK